jgi:IS30 family transposase
MSKSTRNSGKAWTQKEVAQIKELAKRNTPTRVIGLKLGRTPSAIYTKASEKSISLEPHNRSPYGTKKNK